MKISKVDVKGLFGHTDHILNVRENDPTIVIAPNGAGKTHVLRLTAALLSLEAKTLLDTVYKSVNITFCDGREVSVVRDVIEFDEYSIKIESKLEGKPNDESAVLTSSELIESKEALPSGFRQAGSNRWINERTGATVPASYLKRRYGFESNPLAAKVAEIADLNELCGSPRPIFIDTWRLDARIGESSLLGDWDLPRRRGATAAASRIRGYTEKLREEIAEARRASVQATQSADLSFAARALEAADLTVREKELHQRYNKTVERYEALARNGLAVGEAPIPFPEKTTPTVRRILNVFLNDWDRRLKPLLPVNRKLRTLRDVLDDKLSPSGKRTNISARGELEFYNVSGSRLPVSRLSSGEQHLVALFTLLLFAAKSGSLVLIDEPEISLHAAWKHSFLTDISRVAEIGELQVIMATHSAGIINGRWDLTEELELSLDSGAEPVDELETEDDVEFTE